MRKTGVVLLILVALGLLAATYVFYSKYRKSAADFAQATTEEEQTRLQYGQAINEIATIQDSLNAIAFGEEAVQMLPARGPNETQLPPTRRDQVIARISMLKTGLERTKARIQELDDRVKRSKVRIAGLERMLAGLKSTVAEKEQVISQLTTQVDTLETRVTGLSVEVEDTQRELTDRQHELATIFYTIGTKKELIQSGTVVSQGGVLGLGKTLKPSGHFNESAFNTLDTDQENVIQIPSKKAQVLSPQPVASYMLTPAGENRVELRILDPKEFRKVKHLVILTT